MKKILTVPTPIKEYIENYLTGNEYVSIPIISKNGTIDSVNVILDKTNSMIDFSGKGFISPFVKLNEEDLTLKVTKCGYIQNFIPYFNYDLDNNVKMSSRIYAPIGRKGFVMSLSIQNNNDKELKFEAGVKINWEISQSTVFHPKKIDDNKRIFVHEWTNSLILELGGSLNLVSLAISSDDAVHDEVNGISSVKEVYVSPKSTTIVNFYFTLNIESDGAATLGIDFRRRGHKLYFDLISWLCKKFIYHKNHRLEEMMNKNLLFSYFYSTAYTLDTESLVLLTSRSPKYYVSAAFWSRDSLLWSFPGICVFDQDKAKDVLKTSYTRYFKNLGEHALYLNGSSLYPGFELDELAAYIIAVQSYINITGDSSVLNDEIIIDGIQSILLEFDKHYNEKLGLYSTELNPSDDPVLYPYLTYDNVLVYKAYDFAKRNSLIDIDKAKSIKESIMKHCIIQSDEDLSMFAWAVDENGNKELYDDPPGSLILLPYYRFCENDDLILKNTYDFIYSPKNKYFYKSITGNSVGCEHTPYPWLIGILNEILSFKTKGRLEQLSDLKLDNGFACESFDLNTGQVLTGEAFATCAGLLGYTIYYEMRIKDEN